MIPKKDTKTKKKEILSTFKANFSKRLASDIEDEMIEDLNETKKNFNKSEKRSAFHRRATTRLPSPGGTNKLKPLNL